MTSGRVLLVVASLAACGGDEPSNQDGGIDPDAGDLEMLATESASWALNEWHEIGVNQLRSVYLTRAELDAIDPMLWAVSGPDAAISIWSSGAFDGSRLYIGAAGGHGG